LLAGAGRFGAGKKRGRRGERIVEIGERGGFDFDGGARLPASLSPDGS